MRVLALRALGLGDLLTGLPALRALRRRWPLAHLQLAAPAVLAPLVTLSGAVDELVDVGPLQPLPEHAHGADVAVNLHGRGPQSTALLEASGPSALIAWGLGGRVWRGDEHEVRRWCRLLTESGTAADPGDLHLDVPVERHGRVVVHPGAAAASRRWPVARWAHVVQGLCADGADVVVTGGPGELALARELAGRSGLPSSAVLAGHTGLVELAALVAGARLVVAPDTGVAHLATACATPSVLLFGPTSPALWGPPPGPRHRVLWAGREGDPLGAAVDPGLLAISAAEVLATCRAALAQDT